MRTILLAAPIASLLSLLPAAAQVPMSGTFTANQACPALLSIRQQTNPGDVSVQPGQAYRIVGRNKEDASYYLVAIDGAQPPRRWVPVGCGQTDGATVPSVTPAAASAAQGGRRATHVLALGWEPAFCQQHRDKAECVRETGQSFEATHLSLHGLWPQPRGRAYCGVDRTLAQADRAHDWGSLPEPDITSATRQRLSAVMPGTQSGLQRHEWVVHGTCYGTNADIYFNRAASLAEQVNASPVRDLFVRRIGTAVSADEIRGAFDQAFGPGSGARVGVSCPGRGQVRTIGEIVISLAGDVSGTAPLADLIRAATPVPPGCPSGLIESAAR